MNYLTNTSELTAVADAIREKGGTSAPLTYPFGFASAIADIQTGGGAQEIATGTFTGTGEQTITFVVGDKIASTNFVMIIVPSEGAVFPYNNDKYIPTYFYFVVDGELCNIRTGVAWAYAHGKKSVTVKDADGNNVTLTPEGIVGAGDLLKGGQLFGLGTIKTHAFQSQFANNIASFKIELGSTLYAWGNITYSFKIIYYGDDPATEIVTGS